MSDLVIFDLDGVITSEEAYWDAAGLTLHELCYSPRYWRVDRSHLGSDGQYRPAATAEESRRLSRAIFPEADILSLKARAINSNWDTCYAGACLYLIHVLAMLPDISSLLPLQPWDAGWLAALRIQLERETESPGPSTHTTVDPQGVPLHFTHHEMMGSPLATASGAHEASRPGSLFDAPPFKGYVGLELLNRFDGYASQLLGCTVTDVFSRYSPFWAFCRDIFQEWYLGDELYTTTYGHEPAQAGKPGCIHFEQPLLPLEQVRATLESLGAQGYRLGFATGRTRQEAIYPLKKYGLLPYFDEQHIATYDYVERAEAELRTRGDATLLSKPHPFQFLAAVDQRYQYLETRSKAVTTRNFIVVGDSTSDILGGRAAGAITVAVLTGARTAEARQLLAQSKPDFTLNDITQVPQLLTHIDSLATIQHLQFTEREKAERLLQRWFMRHMHLETDSVTLTPKAVSLNSFNGFYRLDGEEFFFKTHVEEQGVLEEYYHAELLHSAGYNVVRPLRTLHEGGRQMVIYPVVRHPVMFDLVRAVEASTATNASIETIIAAEKRESERLLAIYAATLAHSTAEENARAPIHQLFWQRIAGGRLKSFYAGKVVPFPRGQLTDGITFEELLTYHWTINGPQSTFLAQNAHQFTLGELIERAKVVLHPKQEAATIIGHGDAHFGNVFLDDQRNYLYFDPAFAGRHAPLLDIIKPLYHNVWATWMYFPREVARELELTVSVRGKHVYIEHNYALAPVRQALAETKYEYLLRPLLSLLGSRGELRASDSELFRLAWMCCPLLTVNLLDGERFPAAVTWLGLSQAVQLAHEPIIDELR